MKYAILFIVLCCSQLSYGKNKISNLLIKSDWKLINKNAYPYGGKEASEVYKFSVSKDSLLTLTYCYVKFYYKISLINKDSLILIPKVHEKLGEKLVFIKSKCSKENNQFNNPKYLSFRPLNYQIEINDSIGIQSCIVDQYYRKIDITDKSLVDLNNFITNNRYNDTRSDFCLFQTSKGNFGVVTRSENVCVAPLYKKIKIKYQHKEMKNGKLYSIPIICTNEKGIESEYIYYY